MNIYDYAIKMEKDGEIFYRDQAKKTNNAALVSILNVLADSEVKHYKTLEQMKNKDKEANIADTEVLKSAKNIFSDMKDKGENLNLNADEITFYEESKEIEQKAYKFYLEKAGEVENEHYKQIFMELAEEEKKHVVLMENIIEFLSHPISWVENAEFNHMDEY